MRTWARWCQRRRGFAGHQGRYRTCAILSWAWREREEREGIPFESPFLSFWHRDRCEAQSAGVEFLDLVERPGWDEDVYVCYACDHDC